MNLTAIRLRAVVLALALTLGVLAFATPSHAFDAVPDPSFGNDGQAFVDFGVNTLSDDVIDVAVQPDGKIIAVGVVGTFETQTNFAIARFNSDGSLDTSFSGDGKLVLSSNSWDWVSSVALQSDGKIVVAGHTTTPVPCDLDCSTYFKLVRLDSSGNLDASFGSGGIESSEFLGQQFGSVLIQPDGKIVVGGRLFPGGLGILRRNSDGSPDLGFGVDGFVATEEADLTMDLALQPDGKIVVVARSFVPLGPADSSVFRFNIDGSPDVSFGTDGRRFIDLFPPEISIQFEYPFAIRVQSDGKLVISGTPEFGDPGVALYRLHPDGSDDLSFGDGGLAYVDMGTEDSDQASDFVVLEDGRIVVVGRSSSIDFDVAIRNADGSPDVTFDDDGFARFAVAAGSGHASAIAVQPDGNVVMGGFWSEPPPGAANGLVLMRLGEGDAPPPPPPPPPPTIVPVPPPVMGPPAPAVLPPIDVLPPSIKRVKLNRRSIRTTQSCKRYAKLQITLSEAGRLRVEVQRRSKSRRNIKYKRVAILRSNRIKRVHRVKIKPCTRRKSWRSGRYRLRLTAVDETGSRSNPRYVSFSTRHSR